MKCIFCNKEFDTKRGLAQHIKFCKENPEAQERRKILSQNGRNTCIKLNKQRTLERKVFKLTCPTCGKTFEVIGTQSQFDAGRLRKFCSRSCANKRVFSKDTKEKISKSLKALPRVENIKEPRYCIACGKEISIERGQSKYCCEECKRSSMHETLSLAGRHSVEAQSEARRSKNEIAFYDLCKRYFNDVTHNQPIFNGWDADIIINDIKFAVLWNGKWHYEKITKNHSVKQVQSRDKIKISEIRKMGYTPYIIKDMGKYSMTKVQNEFNLFLDYISKNS